MAALATSYILRSSGMAALRIIVKNIYLYYELAYQMHIKLDAHTILYVDAHSASFLSLIVNKTIKRRCAKLRNKARHINTHDRRHVFLYLRLNKSALYQTVFFFQRALTRITAYV